MNIHYIHIENFRSLRSVTLSGLAKAVVLHGSNNSGKSNIVDSLELIFCSKRSDIDINASEKLPSRPTPFWQGKIKNASDLYYLNTNESITFRVELSLDSNDKTYLISNEMLLAQLWVDGRANILRFEGRIERDGIDAIMHLESSRLNGREIYINHEDGIEWLASSNAEESIKRAEIETFFDNFTNCVAVVPADRYLTVESADSDGGDQLRSISFKNWLFKRSISRDKYKTFELVKSWFNQKPFEYGEISFVKDDGRLEIMVDDKKTYRMPITSKGTGVQQLLVLMGFIAESGSKIVCIEEPELNLSFRNQDYIVSALQSLLQLDHLGPSQIIFTSHSDHIGSRNDLQQWHVSLDQDQCTAARLFTDEDRRELFPRARNRERRPQTPVSLPWDYD